MLKFDRENRVVGRLDFEVPGMLALDPEHGRVYAGRSMSAVNPPTRIGEFDTATMSADEVDVFFARPHALSVSPDGRRIYTASLAENQLATLDIETFVLDLQEPLPAVPQIDGMEFKLRDSFTLEASVPKLKSLNALFSALESSGVHVMSMRNKANRLEELFLRLVEKGAMQ